MAKVKPLAILIPVFLFLLIALGFRVEVVETNPKTLRCDFNQQKYEEEMEKYNQCLEESKNEINVFGFFTCGNEPQKGSFYEEKIQYNLVKRKRFKFFGITVLETKRAYPKTCEDF